MKTSRMGKRVLSLLLVLCCVMTIPAGAFSVVSGNDLITGTFWFSPHSNNAGVDLTDTYVYSDQFFADSAYNENKHLATMSMIMASASISSERFNYDKKSHNLEDLLGQLGFSGFATNDCYKSKPQQNTMGAAAAYKNVTIGGKAYTILAVVPRSAGYEREWAGNFTVGSNGLHEGFNIARDRVLSFAKQYVDANKANFTGELKFWTMGYSRGAATANLVGGFLVDCPDYLVPSTIPDGKTADNYILDSKNLYVYTFGTPTCVPDGTSEDFSITKKAVSKVAAYTKAPGEGWNPEIKGDSTYYLNDDTTIIHPRNSTYGCIHNYYADYDPITMMPFPAWGFDRYGVDHVYNASENRSLMLKYLSDVNQIVYDIYVNHGGDPDGFTAKMLDLTNGIGITNDTSKLLTQKEFLLERVTFLSNKLVATRGAYVGPSTSEHPEEVSSNQYQHMLQTLMGLYFGLDETGKDAFVGGVGGTNGKHAAVMAYAYYLFKNLNMSKEQTISILKTLLEQAPAGTDVSEIQEQIKDLENGTDYSSWEERVRGYAKNKLHAALNDGINAINSSNSKVTITDAQRAEITADNVVYPLVDFFAYLVFGTNDTMDVADNNSIFEAAKNQISTAATLIGNSGSYMRVHNNEIILSWLRTQDSYYYYPSSDSGSSSGKTYYTLKFNVNGGSSLSSVRLESGSKVDLANFTPTREGYDFAGWYADSALTRAISSITLGANTTVYAKWTEQSEPEQPIQPTENPFLDVHESDYFFEAVLWAVKNGITAGTSETTFSPSSFCTRADTVTFLWRAAGSPEPKQDGTQFADVADSAYYAKAVRWAAQNGIAYGVADGRFDPNGIVDRAQAVTFLFRANGTAAGSSHKFNDVQAGDYFADAVAWASNSNVTSGTSETAFSPTASCTRGQLVSFLYRCYTTPQ